jgi:glycosyltransferase involved in cell wall biosynthesis
MTATGAQRLLLASTEKMSCKLAHKVLFVSASVREVAIADGICAENKSKVIRHGSINGIDAVQSFNPEYGNKRRVREANNIPLDARVIGFVGRIVRDKGVIELLAAWGSLRKRFDDLYLLVVGPFETKDAISSELKDRLQTDPRIRFVGEVWATPDYYAAMDILAFPSHREGFGLVAIEASSMSLPVVATRIPGIIDSVVDGETGLLVPPRNATALEQALTLYLESKDLRILHGRNGRNRVLADFRPEDIWESMHAEYLELVEKHEPRR